jgi:outer membrane protein OmpA-like peptidoglycan-associated protein
MKAYRISYLLLLFCQIAFGQSKVKVYFDFDDHQLQPESQDTITFWSQNFPNTEIVGIDAYCDSLGSSAYNLKLAQRRLNTVLEIFKQNKVVLSENIALKAIGKDFEQHQNRAENRNVTISYVTQENEMNTTLKVGQKIRLEKLHFYGNSDVVLPESQYVLEKLLQIMISNPTLVIDIQGHICCSVIDYNKISNIRAKAVYDFLLKNGISKDRMSHKGLGSSSPIHALPEQSEEERIINRRVEIEIIKI